MRDACPVEVREIVAGAVIARFIAGDGKVERPPVHRLELHHVGRIGDQPGKVGAQRIGIRPHRSGGEIGQRRTIGARRFEHDRRPADPARFEVDQPVDPRGGSALDERRRAIQAIFLAFVEQQDDRALRPLTSQQIRHLQHHRHPDPVVGRARPGRGAVVMGVDQQRLAPRVAGDGRDDVADMAAADRARLGEPAAIGGLDDLGLDPDRGQLGAQPLTHGIVGGRIDGMRPLVAQDSLEPRHRPLGIELAPRHHARLDQQPLGGDRGKQ